MSVDKFGRYSVKGETPSVYNKQNSGLPVTKEGDYNVGNKRLKFVKAPQDDEDCVTKGYADSLISTSLKMEGDAYNAKGKQIQNVKDPLLPSDTVTMRYMNKMTPTQTDDHWSFADKRLSNIKDPLYPREAVNLETLRAMAICKQISGDKQFNANNLKLANIADCTKAGDAVNKRMLEKTIEEWTHSYDQKLERLGSALFNYIHRHSGQTPNPQVNGKNYLDWTAIHEMSDTTRN